MCFCAILDPSGEFGERCRSRVTSVAEDDGGVVATVTDGSSFRDNRRVNVAIYSTNNASIILLTYRLIDSLHAKVFYQCLSRASSLTARLKHQRQYSHCFNCHRAYKTVIKRLEKSRTRCLSRYDIFSCSSGDLMLG